jgi:hypothetical protein
LSADDRGVSHGILVGGRGESDLFHP